MVSYKGTWKKLSEDMQMKDFLGGWPGLHQHAVKLGICEAHDTTDVACEKIAAELGEVEVETEIGENGGEPGPDSEPTPEA